MDYEQLLNHSFEQELRDDPEMSRMEFVAERIFDFTLYDSEMCDLFGKKAIEVCEVINARTTFGYIENAEDYVWYLQIVNMPFFAERLDWGTSIRGAFWSHKMPELKSHSIYEDGEQLLEIPFDQDEWKMFIAALIKFSRL